MLQPLQQWVCDTCGGIIERPEDGYFQYDRDDNLKTHSFIIVHHKSKSPRHTNDGCYQHDHDDSLTSYIGANGLVNLLSLVDVGRYHNVDNDVDTSDIVGWCDIVRRLHTPYYEEARLYWNRAIAEGYFDDINEVGIYRPGYLKKLIEYYSEE